MSTHPPVEQHRSVKRTEAEQVVIRFAGDSGDGIQVTGGQFTTTSALFGNDIASFPDFPAEIRAPRGTLPGVSGFQLQFASHDIFTAGDQLDGLIAFNPAALKVNLKDLRKNGILVVNEDEFAERDLVKAGYAKNPLEDGSLDGYRLFRIGITTLTRRALEGTGLPTKDMDRCRNFFALGVAYWLYNRPLEPTREWIRKKFKGEVAEANLTALKAGYAYCDATEQFHESYVVQPAHVAPGKYRNISGNSALALGLVAAGHQADTPIFYASYPITPASDILHELSTYRRFRVGTFQAEDEIAAATAAIGAAYAGALAVTGTSGPGLALKMEAINLAVMAELPLVIVDVQRGGPSTGLPTKTEQADLLQALYGRNSESPIAVLAPRTPGDCFHVAFEACRLAVKYMTPVIVLSDGYLANGAEPWPVPSAADLPGIPVTHPTDPATFRPYLRNKTTLARPWSVPGTPGLEHRIGGIEKADVTGNISYDPANHHHMVMTRQAKVDGIAREIPPTEVHGDPNGGDLLVLGWGSTYGALTSGVNRARKLGLSVSSVHVRHLNPLPPDLGDVCGRFRKVLVPELNLGQLRMLVRARFLVDAVGLNKVQGQPFTAGEVLEAIQSHAGVLRKEATA
jgi:2-oxoglutarate ferredoxin oxidoreductase subunit alpha